MADKTPPDSEGGGASQTTEPAAGSSTGTDVSLRDYFFALRQADERLRQADLRFDEERDRRYQEVALEREKALKIKETADLAALGLAREIQTYKDEKANELREQISQERGDYITRTEYLVQHKALEDVVSVLDRDIRAQLALITEYIAKQQGRAGGIGASTGAIVTIVAVLSAIIGTVVVLANVLTR